MNKKAGLLTLFIFVTHFIALSQEPLIDKLDSLNKKTDSAGGQVNNTNPHAYDEENRITTPVIYLTLIASDLKQEFTKPFHMTGRDWGNFAKFAAVGGALAFFDRTIQRNTLDLVQRNPGLQKVSKVVTDFGGLYEGITLGVFGTYSLISKNRKMETTTLLATQAYITGATLESVLKFLTGRTRPSYYQPGTTAIPKFLGPFSSANNGSSSFPSGHTTVAFAAATVFALEYNNKPWVPILAYTSASLIGLSRITENKHWATDVLAGAFVGYLSGRNIVNNYHRYAKLKSAEKKNKTRLSLDLHLMNGYPIPGLTCTF